MNYLTEHQIGNVVRYPSFTSSSHRQELKAFGPHRLVIEGRTGKSLEFISKYGAEEAEVVFNAPTRFLITDRYVDNDGIITMLLEEL